MGGTLEDDAIEPLGIDEEMEMTPTQSLVSGPTTLAPGINSVKLSAKVSFHIIFVRSFVMFNVIELNQSSLSS